MRWGWGRGRGGAETGKVMEGELAMLRQLIGQVQELLELYGGSPPTTFPPNYVFSFQPLPPPEQNRHQHR